jgi:hypothetical protein
MACQILVENCGTKMPLILKRNNHTPEPDRFLVYSGKAAVGTLMRVPTGEKKDWWHWSITGFHVSPADLSVPVPACHQAKKRPWPTSPSAGGCGWTGRVCGRRSPRIGCGCRETLGLSGRTFGRATTVGSARAE